MLEIFSFLSLGLIALLCSATTPSTPFKTAQAWLKEEELKQKEEESKDYIKMFG